MSGPVRIVALIVAFMLGSNCGGRRPYCYVFDAKFQGWASVEFGVGSAEVAPSAEGCVELDLRTTVNLKTAAPHPAGMAEDKYMEDVGGALRPLAFGEHVAGRAIQHSIFELLDPKHSIEWIFVGTREEFNRSPVPRDDLKGVLGPMRK